MANTELNINIKWTSIEDIYWWINTINNAFDIKEIDIFNIEKIIITSSSIFIPIHMLILLWHNIIKLEKLRKWIVLKVTTEVSNFINKCWLEDFINTSSVNSNLLSSSVVLPFSKLTTPKECQQYLINFEHRLLSNKKYEIIDHIWELHDNAIVHWKTQDIYIMWQLYPLKQKVHILIYDAWKWMINKNIDDFIKISYKNYITEEFYKEVQKKFWNKVLFVILCVSTWFSTRWKQWWMWLQELSKFLYENSWSIHISTENMFIDLKFKKICSKIDIGDIDIKISNMQTNLKGTYISFNFSI